MNRDLDPRAWTAARLPAWRDAATLAQELRGHRRLRVQDATAAMDTYRALGRDLATARRLLPQSTTTAGLEALYAELHVFVGRAPRNLRADTAQLFREEIPAIVHSMRGAILWVSLLFALSSLAGWFLVTAYPELIGLLASEAAIESVESGRLWTEGLLNVMPSSVLSVSILANNIMVSVVAFCLGAFFGVGTFYIIANNGLMLGGMFAFTHQHGLAGGLLQFVVAHGPVELSVICIAGAAGVSLGEALIRPTLPTRRESFQQAATRAARLLVLCALLLVGCGFIEGYLSPDPDFPMASRVVVGACWWVLMLAALTGRLFGARPRAADPPGRAV